MPAFGNNTYHLYLSFIAKQVSCSYEYSKGPGKLNSTMHLEEGKLECF